MNDERLSPDDDAERARLHALFEAQARESEDAEIILGTGLIDNAVETALHVMHADDPALVPVIAAFRGGDVVEASALLADLVSDIQQALQNTHDADEQARLHRVTGQIAWTKGALSACWSLADAREWYEAALQICDDNFWLRVEAVKFLLWTGEEEEARAWIVELLQHADDPDALVAALSEFGDIHEQRGEYREALFHYQRALATLQRAADAHPADLQARLDLTRAYADIARMQEETGDEKAGLESRESGLATLRTLLDMAPTDRLLGDLYAGQLIGYALALRSLERWDEARAIYGEALATLADRTPPDHEVLFLSGLAQEGIGDTHDEQGAADAAHAAWQEASRLYRACSEAAGDGRIAEAGRQKAGRRLAEIEEKLG